MARKATHAFWVISLGAAAVCTIVGMGNHARLVTTHVSGAPAHFAARPSVQTTENARLTASARDASEAASRTAAQRVLRALQARTAVLPMTDAAVAPAEPDDDETVAVQVDAGRTVPKRADLERQFVLESADPKWTSEAYEYTVHALQDAKLASDHIRSVDCRRSLCQVELKFASLEEARSLYELRHPDYELTYFIDADRYTVYFAREGVRLAAAAD